MSNTMTSITPKSIMDPTKVEARHDTRKIPLATIDERHPSNTAGSQDTSSENANIYTRRSPVPPQANHLVLERTQRAREARDDQCWAIQFLEYYFGNYFKYSRKYFKFKCDSKYTCITSSESKSNGAWYASKSNEHHCNQHWNKSCKQKWNDNAISTESQANWKLRRNWEKSQAAKRELQRNWEKSHPPSRQ